jgi:hypothetical protein
MPNDKDKGKEIPNLFKTSNEAFTKGEVISSTKGPIEEKPVPSTLKEYVSAEVNDAEGFEQAPEQKEEKPTRINLEDLNESTLLKYPIIAKSLNDAPMAVIKPKDSSLIFHWIYYDRTATGNSAKVSAKNVQRYKFWGFEFASVQDVEGGEEALGDGMIDDGENIINYDTVLMKVNKVRLMQHYKKNLLDSLLMTDASLRQAILGAEQEVKNSGMYRKAMETHPKAKIEFYSPLESSK